MRLTATSGTVPVVRATGAWPARGWPLLVAAAATLVAVMVGAVAVGKATIPLDQVIGILAHRVVGLPVAVTWPVSAEVILIEIRLPRIVLAALVGTALAVAGTGYQGLFRNPLADPYLLGVAAGGGLGATIALVLPLPPALHGYGIVQLFAFLGALATVATVFGLARVGRTTPATTLLLAGVAIGAFAGAINALLMYLHNDKLLVVYSWMLGGFNLANWQQVLLIAPGVLASAVVIALVGRLLNVMQLDDEQAAALGVRVERLRLLVVVAATLATAVAVSVSGLIGFVGLIVPHTVRLIAGPDHRRLVPLTALVGATFLVVADTGARSIPGAAEVPVGIVTALCGAPFFVALLRRQKRAVY